MKKTINNSLILTFRRILFTLLLLIWVILPFLAEPVLLAVTSVLIKSQIAPLLLNISAFSINMMFWLLLLLSGQLLLVLLFGRIYCSILCPLAIAQEILIKIKQWWTKPTVKKVKDMQSNFRPNRGRLGRLLAMVIIQPALAGFPLFLMLLDPYTLFYRNYSDLLLAPAPAQAFFMALATLLLFVWLVLRCDRLYCDRICPVGTGLRLLADYSFFRLNIDRRLCDQCGLCAASCPVGCIDNRYKSLDNGRCVRCLSCIGRCRRQAISFGRHSGRDLLVLSERPKVRRAFLTFTAIGAIAGLAVLSKRSFRRAAASALPGQPAPLSDPAQMPVLPPGAVSLNHFQQHCTGCHLCVRSCPSRGLHSGLALWGALPFFQPFMNFQRGYCDYNCKICGSLCPSGAIQDISLTERQQIQCGRSRFFHERCIVVSENTACGACAEVCPVEAVVMVVWRDNLTLPFLHPELCIGCGHCQFACPLQSVDKAIMVEPLAVHRRVSYLSIEEKRHREQKAAGAVKPVDNVGSPAGNGQTTDEKKSPFAF